MEPMRYLRGETNVRGDSRMEPFNELTIGQMIGLPDGTEILIVSIEMLGMEVNQRIVVIDDTYREYLLSPDGHANCDHGTSPAELEQLNFPGSIFVVLYPENWEPSVGEMLDAKFVRQGTREGREGAPMYSEVGLKTRYSDEEWHDGAYGAYVAAYKRAAEARKGR